MILHFSKGQKHYTFIYGFDGNDNVEDYDYQARARKWLIGSIGNVEINLEEARQAKDDVFTDIAAVRYFLGRELDSFLDHSNFEISTGS